MPNILKMTKGHCVVCEHVHEFPLHVPPFHRTIVHCKDIEGKCCPSCHRIEDSGRFGLQVATSADNKTAYLACCFKLQLLEIQLGDNVDAARRGYRKKDANLTWEMVRKIRSLYKAPTGKFYAGGPPVRYNCVSLARFLQLPTSVVQDVVLNKIWTE